MVHWMDICPDFFFKKNWNPPISVILNFLHVQIAK